MKILYHANCNDGSGAALAAWMLFSDEGNEYIPVQYGSLLPDGLDGEEVVMLDFSVKRPEIIDLDKRAKMVWIIDHHASAERELDGIERETEHVVATFDMNQSGAVLAWKNFHDGQVPKLLQLVQDRDLWRFELNETKAVCAALQLLPDFREWRQFIDEPNLIDHYLVPRGKAILKYLEMQSEKILVSEQAYATIGEDTVPVYNLLGFLISDTLHKALDKHDWAPFVASYFEVKGKRVYSLRSRKGSDVDVGKIAAQYGGGGHKHAAGFSVPIEDIDV